MEPDIDAGATGLKKYYVVIRLSGGNIAETVGILLGGLTAPHDPQNPAYNWDEADEPPAATLAYVVHTAPANGKLGNNECQTYQAGDNLTDHTETVENSLETSYNKHKEDKPPVLRTACAAFEIGILVKTDLNGLAESDIRTLRHGVLHRSPLLLEVLLHDYKNFEYVCTLKTDECFPRLGYGRY